METTTGYARSPDGTNLAYTVVGDGPIDLVWNNGFATNVEMQLDAFPQFGTFVRRLARFARVILWDRRGFGGSDRPTTLPLLEDQLDDLRAVLDAVGSESTSLMGVSEGGPMSALFAASYPKRVSHLVLIGSFAKLIQAADNPHGISWDRALHMAEQLVTGWGKGTTADVFAPSVADAPGVRDIFSRWERSAASPANIEALFRLLPEIDIRRVLPNVTAPTTIIVRKGDPICPLPLSEDLAARIEHATLVVLPGVDHIPTIGDTDEMIGEIEQAVTGRRAKEETDRVLGTVLFTDIVGSTERAVAVGDATWRGLLESHHEAVRAQLQRFRGTEIKSTGDGFLAMFDGPTRAIRCARAATDAVRSLGLEIRAGLHTGECEIMGEDIGGIAVHIASRVAGLAGSGEVLVSRTVKDLSAGSGLAYDDRGVHTLKGIPDEWQLYAVRE